MKGYKGQLNMDNLYETPEEFKAENAIKQLEKNWPTGNAKPKKDKWLLKQLRSSFLKELIAPLVHHFIQAVVTIMVNAISLKYLIESFSEDKPQKSMQYIYALIFTISTAVGIVVFHHEFFSGQRMGMRIRIACSATVYQKVLRLPKAVIGSVPTGVLISIISTDLLKLEQAATYLGSPIIEPISLVILLLFLVWLFGPCVIGGFVALMLLTMYCILQGKIHKKIRNKIVALTDERLKATHGMLSDIRAIKMFTWETSFANIIEEKRKLEMKHVTKVSLLRTINITNFLTSSKLGILPILVTNYLIGALITPSLVFVTTAVFASLRTRLTNHLSKEIPFIAESMIAMTRLENILNLTENICGTNSSTEKMALLQPGIIMENANISWTKDSSGFGLKDVSLSIRESSLHIITGTVGSGKSSLLMAMLHELYLHNGKISTKGRISYVPQDAWIFPGTIRQNIVFGDAFDKERYNEVLHVCALIKDIGSFMYGDETHVGDKGISLSGGQKARINLARAMYHNGDIFIMDDPLSALDSHVGRHVFENCIYGQNMSKIRVLVTHHLHYIKKNYPVTIISLKEGKISKKQSITEPNEDDLAKDYITIDGENKKESNLTESEKLSQENSDNLTPPKNETVAPTFEESSFKAKSSLKTYLSILFTSWTLIIFILLHLVGQTISSLGDVWVCLWSKSDEAIMNAKSSLQNVTMTVSPKFSTSFLGIPVESPRDALLIYSVAFLLTILFSFGGSWMYFIYNQKASQYLHQQMLKKITMAKMSFFDSNPVGRIMNRFSKDVSGIDDNLPLTFYDGLARWLNALGMIGIVIYSSHPSAIAVVIIVALSGTVCYVFMKASEEVKRLESITMSPIFIHVNSTIRGLSTIRAQEKQHILMEDFKKCIDLNTSVAFLILGFTRWAGLYLEMALTILAFAVAATMISFSGPDTTGTFIGLAITSIFSVSSGLQYGVRQSIEARIQMTSIDRILEYMNLDSEDGYTLVTDQPKLKRWPQTGTIVFRNLNLIYERTQEVVLKSLNFTILDGENIGIVGRTGAGKTSITTALFRLAKLEGSIIIDGENIETIPLLHLRQKLSIIPQDPVLLIGTIRYNLDPFNEHEDNKLWSTLESVHLKEYVVNLDGGLNAIVTEGGGNFSVGQRQLLCVARAILKNNKILILDEATSNIDKTNDDLVHEVVRQNCKNCTILTIAHRLETVMNMDRIMVLQNGAVIEFDTPRNLLQKNDSAFSKLVDQMGDGKNQFIKTTNSNEK